MTLRFDSPGHGYDISVGRGLLAEASRLFDLNRKVLVVTDEGVPEEYSRKVLDQCAAGSLLVIPQGEGAKSFATLETILSELLRLGLTRSDAIVAVGGGVTGDVAGFAAACYQRGIDYYNVPTTLLSQVDSSVGGKTAVNFMGVKNIVGAFHHPSGVLVDPDVLDTLSPRLFAEGMAEVIKMAATLDAALFERIEAASDLEASLPEIIYNALKIKLDVVSRDPSEKGLRAVLNFGHTIGHAIEALGAAGQQFLHGEAVAAGMMYTSEGSARPRIEALLHRFCLPTSDDYSAGDLMRLAVSDKKRHGSLTRLVLCDEIGSYRFCDFTDAMLLTLIQKRKDEK